MQQFEIKDFHKLLHLPSVTEGDTQQEHASTFLLRIILDFIHLRRCMRRYIEIEDFKAMQVLALHRKSMHLPKDALLALPSLKSLILYKVTKVRYFEIKDFNVSIIKDFIKGTWFKLRSKVQCLHCFACISLGDVNRR